MSLVGVGSASIDLILPKVVYQQGEVICGYFEIKGGLVEQQLKRVECDLVQFKRKEEDRILDTATILSSTIIKAEELYKISFTFRLPEEMPCSGESQSYGFKTRLIFDEGVKSVDHDPIKIIS